MDIRELLTGKKTIVGTVQWFGELREALATRHSDDELLIALPSGVECEVGGMVAIADYGFPLDGAHVAEKHPDSKLAAAGTAIKVKLEAPHGIDEPTTVMVGAWRKWNVYDTQALSTMNFLALQRIQSIDIPEIIKRPEGRKMEQVAKFAQVESLMGLAQQFDGLNHTAEMNLLSEFIEEGSPESRIEEVSALLIASESAALSDAGLEVLAQRPIDMKAIEMAMTREAMPLLKEISEIDFGPINELQSAKVAAELAELQDESDLVAAYARELEILCMMPANLLSFYAAISPKFKEAVLRFRSSVAEVLAPPVVEVGFEGKPQAKKTRAKTS